MRGTGPRAAGWRERVALPLMGCVALEAKLDTGARSSALHATEVEPFEERGRRRVRFKLAGQHGLQVADLVEMRRVRDSSGRVELRPVLMTRLVLGGTGWPIELTLTGRGSLSCPLLLGRRALAGRVIVHPDAKYLLSTPTLARRAAVGRLRRSRA